MNNIMTIRSTQENTTPDPLARRVSAMPTGERDSDGKHTPDITTKRINDVNSSLIEQERLTKAEQQADIPNGQDVLGLADDPEVRDALTSVALPDRVKMAIDAFAGPASSLPTDKQSTFKQAIELGIAEALLETRSNEPSPEEIKKLVDLVQDVTSSVSVNKLTPEMVKNQANNILHFKQAA